MTIYTDKVGKANAVAKGAKRSKSKFLSTTLQFCFGEYVLFRGKSLYTINEGLIIESFQELLNDLESITYASYLCELMDICLQEEENNRDLFKEFVSALYIMKSKAVNLKLLARAFEVKLLEATGYGLELERCSVCRKKIKTSSYFNISYSGGICDECDKTHSMNIGYSTYNILKYLCKTDIQNIYKLSVSDEDNKKLYKLLVELIYNNFGKMPKSLDTLEFI